MVSQDLEDDQLKEIALQLSGHMDSMRTNLDQTAGLLPKMTSTSAALRSILSRHLDRDQYEKVLLVG